MRSLSLFLSCLLISLLAIPLASADASYHEDIGDGLEVDIRPLRLTLANGEEGNVVISITNSNNVTMYVQIVHYTTKSPAASSTEIEPGYMTIQPGTSATSRVSVHSYADPSEHPDTSDVLLAFFWSTVDDPDMMRNETYIGTWTYMFDIEDDFPEHRVNLAFLIALLIMVPICLVIILWVVRSQDKPGPAPGPPGEKH